MTVFAGVALIGATAGMASAASYPEPFTSNTAVVFGANADMQDNLAAGEIVASLNAAAVGTGSGDTIVLGGDSVLIERPSNKINLNDNITAVDSSSLDDSDLPSLLAEGTYLDSDNTEYDFKQKVDLGAALRLDHFSDSDFNEDEAPVIGLKIPSSTHVLNYTLDFTSNPEFNVTLLESTNMLLMGKNYYVLDATNASTNTMTLLDSADDTILSEGGTVTLSVGGETYVISSEFIGATEVKLVVNGEITNSLEERQTYKLSSGAYVGIKDIMHTTSDTRVSKVEFSIGSGKLKISHDGNVELNDNQVDEITGYLETSGSKLDKIVLSWAADDEVFVAEDSTLSMPGFGSIKLSLPEVVIPHEETVKIKNDGDSIELTAPITDGEARFNLLGNNATGFNVLGKDSSNRLVTTNETSLTFNETRNDKWFVVSYNTSSDSESYLLSASITHNSDNNITTIKNVVTGKNICENLIATDTCDLGSATLTVSSVYDIGSDEWAVFAINTGGSFNDLYTTEGLRIFLPWEPVSTSVGDPDEAGGVNGTMKGSIYLGTDHPNWTTGVNQSSYYLHMEEEDKEGALALGNDLNVTLSLNTDNEPQISQVAQAGTGGPDGLETGDGSKNYETYSKSDLATKIVHFTDGDQDTVELTYHGDELYGKFYVSSEESTITSGGSNGVMTYFDNEGAMFAGMNLVVVGGSAINTVAADLLGGAYAGEAFTTATGVAAGGYLIQSFDRSGMTALLVAGYNAADTTKATTYLLNNDVDTTVGKKYTGTTATEAILV